MLIIGALKSQSMYQNLPAIPAPKRFYNATSYRNIPIDLHDSRAAEPLVKYADYGIACESFYARRDGHNWPYNEPITGATRDVWGRSTLAQKLLQVNEFLRSFNAEVLVVDGYRPITCQQGLWDFFSRQAEWKMPQASPEEKLDFVRTYVSDPQGFDPADETSWPIHVTGGAVDLLLKKHKGQDLLDMGARFDEMSQVAATAYFEGELKTGRIAADDPRLLHRRLLYAAMTHAGFTNYPNEFWHYDYGDQMYVMYAAETPAAAWYGYIFSPEGD